MLRQAGFIFLGGWFALLWAGCGTSTPIQQARVPDWEDAPSIAAREKRMVIATNAAVAPKPAPPVAKPEPAPSPAPKTATETWISLARLSQANGWNTPVRQENGPPLAYSLGSLHGVVLLRAGLRTASWEGTDVRLGFPPMAVGPDIFVHRLDAEKVLVPLLSGGRFLPFDRAPVIVIDPGHGGLNAGTRSSASKLYEKDFTLDWAERLARLLATNGWTALLTRTNDEAMALSNRVAFADQHHADFFLSLHFNSSPGDATQAGLETYCLTPAGMPSTLTRGYEDDVNAAFPNNAFDAQNLALALALHRQLLETSGEQDRGVRHARFPGVLRNQQRPAVLIEGAYLSNPREAARVEKAGFRQKLAEAIARGLQGIAPKKIVPASLPTASITEIPPPAESSAGQTNSPAP